MTALTSDWIHKIPFVCPTQLLEQQPAAQKRTERLTARGEAGLASAKAVYPVVRGVPVLLPQEREEPAGEAERAHFYDLHYGERSRDVDLLSGYLAGEREEVRKFVTERNIRGLVLEVGCGTGIFADCSPEYLGMDYSLSSVFSKGFEGYRRFVGDAQCIPLETASVELVFSYNTLEHVPRPDFAFLEIDRVLASGGYALLHPAWNCSFVQNRLIPVRSYRELKAMDRVVKALLPVMRSRLCKAVQRLPGRLFRALAKKGGGDIALRFGRLQPYLGTDVFIADCDACASIDVLDAVLFFQSRGYECLSHPTLASQVLSGHRPVVVRKP